MGKESEWENPNLEIGAALSGLRSEHGRVERLRLGFDLRTGSIFTPKRRKKKEKEKKEKKDEKRKTRRGVSKCDRHAVLVDEVEAAWDATL